MAKLSKAENKKQKELFDLIQSDKILTDDERWNIYENFNPGFISNVGLLGQFFTPINLAQDVAVMSAKHGHIIDCCSGIGMLAYRLLSMDYYNCSIKSMTLIELNPEFLKISKRLLAGMKNEKGEEYKIKFINGDVFNKKMWDKFPLLDKTQKDGAKFNVMVSNPPFGNIKSEQADWLNYKGKFDLMVLELCLKYAEYGYFILPPQSAPFRYSGAQYYERRESKDYERFIKANTINNLPPKILVQSDGIDSSIYRDDWKGTKITVEACAVEMIDA